MAFTLYRPELSGPVLGVLFDMDGVILDTEKLYTRFWREAAQSLGYPMTQAQALGMRSLNRQAGAEKLCSYFGADVCYEAVRTRRIELMDAYVRRHGVEPKPGIRELMAHLQALGIPAAIATSSPIERVKEYLIPLGLYSLFDRVVTGYDVARGKPEPDIYLQAAGQLGLAPESCMALEDSAAGILSAYRAGCKTVMVPDQDPPDAVSLSRIYALADSLTDVRDFL